MRFLLAVAVVLGALPSGAEANAALDVRSLLAGEDRWRRVLDEVEHDAEGQRRNEALVLEDAYRATVAAWGSGEYILAVDALADLERRFVREEDRRCLDWMERHTLETLARRDPEVLLSLLSLRVALWEHHLGNRRFWLARRASRRLVDAVELAARQDMPSARPLAARFLTYWGERELVLNLFEDAEETLGRALELDPELPEALALRALIFERLGENEAAMTDLERLAALRPDDPEARLRLGIQLGRGGRVAEAVKILRGLVGARSSSAHGVFDPGDAWVSVLAIQEAARLLAGGGSGLREAIELVEEGLERHPESERLKIQLAHLLRRRDGWASPLAAELLDGFAGDPGPSPRFLYEPLSRDMDSLRRTLLAEIDRRGESLVEILARPASDAARSKSIHCQRKTRLLER